MAFRPRHGSRTATGANRAEISVSEPEREGGTRLEVVGKRIFIRLGNAPVDALIQHGGSGAHGALMDRFDGRALLNPMVSPSPTPHPHTPALSAPLHTVATFCLVLRGTHGPSAPSSSAQ